MMDTSQLKQCLENYFAAVDSQKTENPIELKPALMALEEISTQVPSECPSQLKHYLESRSYRKAYIELGGQRD